MTADGNDEVYEPHNSTFESNAHNLPQKLGDDHFTSFSEFTPYFSHRSFCFVLLQFPGGLFNGSHRRRKEKET